MLPAESELIDLVQRSARLLARNRDALGKRPMVLPNAEFFPDRFTFDQSSAEGLLERMQQHAGMLDLPIEVRLVSEESDDPTGAHGCAGTCAAPSVAGPTQRVVPDSEGWTLQLSPAELHHPVALTCTLARSLASIFLVENAARPEQIDTPFEVSVDLAATALGFGVLLLEGSHIYGKSCGGPSIAQVTTLNVGQMATLFALFSHVHGHKAQKALRELSPTQRAAVDDALYWAKTQRALLDALTANPQALLSGPIVLSQEQSLFSRLFRRSRSSDEDLDRALAGDLGLQLAVKSRNAGASKSTSSTRDAAHLELKALVAEALDNSGK